MKQRVHNNAEQANAVAETAANVAADMTELQQRLTQNEASQGATAVLPEAAQCGSHLHLFNLGQLMN